MPDTENEIKITNLGEAVALVTLGFKLLRLENTGRPRQRWMIFEQTHPDANANSEMPKYPIIDFAVAAYRNRKMDIEARTFFETIKDIKTRIISSYTPDEIQP